MKNDFSSVADPWLRKLNDDPSRSLPESIETTTFPLGGAELEGRSIEIDIDGKLPSALEDRFPSDEDIEAGRGAFREVGTDVLAFYKSFRFRDRLPCRGLWGIFLIDAGIGTVEAEFAISAPDLSRTELRELAVATLLAHEQYHFWIDAWALGQEILPAWNRIKHYEYYLAGRRNCNLMAEDVEESLANHYAFSRVRSRKLSNGRTANHLIRSFMAACPEPYCDFSFGSQVRVEREGLLATAVANGISPIGAILNNCQMGAHLSAAAGVGIRPAHAAHSIFGLERCPVYEFKATGYAAIVQPFQGPQINEFRQFVERYLAGIKESTTDHNYYRIDNGEKLKIPNEHDKEIRGYELKNTLIKAGMTLSDFRNARLITKKWRINCPRSGAKQPLSK